MTLLDYINTVSKIINSSDIKDQLIFLHELIIAARSEDQAASREVDQIIKTLKTQSTRCSCFKPDARLKYMKDKSELTDAELHKKYPATKYIPDLR